MYPQQRYIHENIIIVQGSMRWKIHLWRRPSFSTAIIMIVNTLTLANALNAVRLTNPKTTIIHCISYTTHTYIHTSTHIHNNYYDNAFTHCGACTHSYTFIPSVQLKSKMKYIHRRQINLKHIRPQFCRFYTNSLIFLFCCII